MTVFWMRYVLQVPGCLISRVSLSHGRFLSLVQLTLTKKQDRTLCSGQLYSWPHSTISTMSPAPTLHLRPTLSFQLRQKSVLCSGGLGFHLLRPKLAGPECSFGAKMRAWHT